MKTKNNKCKIKFFKTENKRKLLLYRIILIIIIAFVILGILYGVLYIVSPKDNKNDEVKIERSFYQPEEGEDIRQDEEYLEKQREITYNDGFGTGYYITDGDYLSRGGLPLVLMSHYFDALKNGSCAKLNAMFSDAFIKENGEFDVFSPQGIYDIEVTFESEKTDEETGDTITVLSVSYKIMKNDGTFRRDIGSDSSRKQYFTIIETDSDIEINDITDVVLIV